MRRKYILRTICSKCGRHDATSYSLKRELAEASRGLPDPFYCYDCNPRTLHGDALLDYALSMIGKRIFSLYIFKTYRNYTNRIETISHVECDQMRTYSVDKEQIKIGWTRIYFINHKGEAEWETVERMRTVRIVTDADIAEIVGICNERIANAWGYTIEEQVAGYRRIIQEVTESAYNYYVLP